MKVIHKHRLSRVGGNTDALRIHEGARLLHVGVQKRAGVDVPVAWFEVDDTRPTVWLDIRSVHTGVYVGDTWAYMGTAIMDGGSHVTHYYTVT
jgi:hypothetical protein